MSKMTPLDFTRKMAKECQIQWVWPVQAELSDFLIWKFREEIIRGLVSLRRDKIDHIARESRRKKWISYDEYPIGECLWIRDCVFYILERTPRDVYPKLPNVSPFSMSLRKVWAIQHDKYMQNAIQAGSYIIDAANDTCDRYKYPVSVQKIEHSGMRNPRNHADLCDVLEKYWWVKCYPNIYYPILAPFFPVIFSFEGKVWFWCAPHRLDAGGVLDGFISAENFIFQSPFSDKRLSEEEESQLVDFDSNITVFTGTKVSRAKVRKMFSLARSFWSNKVSAYYLGFLKELRQSALLLKGWI